MAVGCSLGRLLLDRNQPGVVDAQPGQRIRLTCRAEGFPPPAIEWQRDGQPLSSPRFVFSSSLSPPVPPPAPDPVQAWGRELPGDPSGQACRTPGAVVLLEQTTIWVSMVSGQRRWATLRWGLLLSPFHTQELNATQLLSGRTEI